MESDKRKQMLTESLVEGAAQRVLFEVHIKVRKAVYSQSEKPLTGSQRLPRRVIQPRTRIS